MNRRLSSVLLGIVLGVATVAALPQVVIQPTPLPTVTADNARWYLDGEPISYAGNLYYASGPQVFFNPNEMVRSGFYDGIPLYTRTTIEPYSVVYVPLAGGRMQPYARPRSGELTGTAGSLPTTLPTPPETVPPAGLAPRAAAPPASTTTSLPVQQPRPMVAEPVGTAARQVPAPVGTAGPLPPRPSHVSIGGKPQGENAMFIEFQGRRWYPAGAAAPMDVSAMVRVGEYHGFDVFSMAHERDEIVIPSTRSGAAFVRYTGTKPQPKKSGS